MAGSNELNKLSLAVLLCIIHSGPGSNMKTRRAVALALAFMLYGASGANDASSVYFPAASELKARPVKNSQPEALRISFRQLCFSFARDGEKAKEKAALAFRKLSGQPLDSDAGAANLADHLILRSYYGDRTREQVAKVFGPIFARSLFRLKPGSWQGPIESLSGWHLIWLDSIASGRVQSSAEVQAQSDPDEPPSGAPNLAAVFLIR
jgi:hypothetical protein